MSGRVILFLILLMPACVGAILGDLDRSGQVDFNDFFLLADNFGKKGPPNPPDTVVVVRVDTLQQVVRDTVVAAQRPFSGTALLPARNLSDGPCQGAIMDFVWIAPGTFMMGSPDSDTNARPDEKPQHQVTISRGFWLGKYEITQEQWSTVMGTKPWSRFASLNFHTTEYPDNPVSVISWNDMQEFIHRLNFAAGDSLYRLPTEAEWEYACRAGTTKPWSCFDESVLHEYANYSFNSGSYLSAVGYHKPNPWGLFDMHGNVCEWVQNWNDVYSSLSQTDPQGLPNDGYAGVRGGTFESAARSTRSAGRNYQTKGGRDVSVGARLLRIK